MRVAVVTYLYPTEKDPEAGLFVQQEVDVLRERHGLEVKVFRLPIEGRVDYLRRNRQIEREVEVFRPDLVHLHGGLALGPMRGWRGHRVVTFHGSDLVTRRGRCLSRLFLRRQDRLIVVAKQLRGFLPSWAVADVVSCGVDTSIFYAREARPAVRRRAATIGFPSNPGRPEKNYELFRRVMEELERQGWNLAETRFTGMSRREVAEALGQTDCLLYTSIREGSPVLSKEAMCAGCRVVGVPVGDLEEQVEGLSGCAVGDRDPRILAGLVERCLGEPGPDPRAAAARFSVATEAERVHRIYGEVLAGE